MCNGNYDTNFRMIQLQNQQRENWIVCSKSVIDFEILKPFKMQSSHIKYFGGFMSTKSFTTVQR